ncbi:P-loop containing nucleoside triphosphate hydrolase protein [Chytriomyces sp. MP71]|nr:P-loop containing nucleoside triphosphate hydrolase protein [Chytriomyces sp. MP71]
MTPAEREEALKDPMPWEQANWLDKITFWWVTKVIIKGSKKTLDASDMWRINDSMAATPLAEQFAEEFERQVELNKKNLREDEENAARGLNTKPKGLKPGHGKILQRTIWILYFHKLFPTGFINLGTNVFSNLSPLFINYIIAFASARSSDPDSNPIWHGFLLCTGLFLLQMGSSLCSTNFFQFGQYHSIRVRTTMTSLIYRKAMRLSAASRQEYNSGRIITMVATDSSRMESFLWLANVFWTAPFNLALMVGFLVYQLGWPALVGVAILVGLVPIQFKLFKIMSGLRRNIAPVTDQRVKKTTEVLNGIRVIKFFAWENSFLEEIGKIRATEIGLVLKRSILSAFGLTIAYVFPVISAAVSFIVYAQFNVLSPARIFSALSWFNMLQFPLQFYPMLVNSWADFNIALTRIESFLLAPELEEQPEIKRDHPFALSIENGEFKWETGKSDMSVEDESKDWSESNRAHTEKSQLRNINLNFKRGDLVAVVGAVGSGKSSLLNAIIGEMKRENGSVVYSGNLGYAPQSAWIQNATLKENILFGNDYDEERYRATISACALEPDLRVLPAGDLTSIGERGINLSGGQKQRVNLARLLYYDADIVLMDDPLSAVDAHVGKHLFEECIVGAMSSKTRVLVTHQLHFLGKVDHVIVMNNGEITEQGGYADLLAKEEGEFSRLIRNYGATEKEDEDDETVGAKKENKKVGEAVNGTSFGKDIIVTEDRDTGSVKADVWLGYIQALGGVPFVVGCLLLLVSMQGVKLGNDFFLADWTSNTLPLSQGAYTGIYLSFGAVLCLLTFSFGVFFAYAGTRAAKQLQNRAISRIIRAPVHFFDTNPMGRILNRFSKDQDTIDQILADSYRQFLTSLASALSTFILIIYATPIFVVPLFPILLMYYFMQRLYRNTSRELKRLDSTSRSPLYANFGATLLGLPTIRAYGEQSRFIRNNDAATNANNSPYWLLAVSQMWLSVRLQFLGALLVFFAAMFGVLGSTTISAAILGLQLTYALQVTQILNQFVSQFTNIEIAMNAVERVNHFANHVDTEGAAIIESHRPPKGWPGNGSVSFKNVTMRYSADQPLVIKGVSFDISDKQKVGVVGRTGSGKSSLMQVLFRMVEPESGEVIVDGINTKSLGLTDLRSRLAIIPQDPVLFSGTFRSNLDPFNEHTDSEVWDAVTRAGLKNKVSESHGLEGFIQDGGDNLSVGQRQLLCLARAMLKKPKILVMDEATANVDYETDAFIQAALRTDFQNSTILTIAHRLNTIIDYDRVLVLDAGLVAEFDSPLALLTDTSSKFYSMVAETGSSNLDLLKSMTQGNNISS